MFEALNDNGKLQFSVDINHFYFLEKGTLVNTAVQNAPDLGIYVSACSKTGLTSYDFVAWSCENFSLPMPQSAKGSTDTGFVYFSPMVPYTVKYWTFKATKSLTPRSSGVGLELYDYQGKVCFSSDKKPVYVVQQIPVATMPASPITYTIPAGRKYAFSWYGGAPFTTAGLPVGVKNFGTHFTIGPIDSSVVGIHSTQITPIANGQGGGLLVLDVTDY